jgi:hypothetical protein
LAARCVPSFFRHRMCFGHGAQAKSQPSRIRLQFGTKIGESTSY